MKSLTVAAVAAISILEQNIQAQNKKWESQRMYRLVPLLHNIEVKQSQNRIPSLKSREKYVLKSSFLARPDRRSSTTFSLGRALNQIRRAWKIKQTLSTVPSLAQSAEMPLFTGFKTSASITRNKLIYWRLRAIRN